MQNMQQKLIQQSPGGNQQVRFLNETTSSIVYMKCVSLFIQIAFASIQNAEHPEGVMSQQHNQTIMITASQAQPQQPPQTPPIQQVNFYLIKMRKIKLNFQIDASE